MRNGSNQERGEGAAEDKSLQPGVRSEAEVEDHNRGAYRDTVANDPERPRVAGVGLVNEPADGTFMTDGHPTLEQAGLSTLRAIASEAVLQGAPDAMMYVGHGRGQSEGCAVCMRSIIPHRINRLGKIHSQLITTNCR